ncbi:cryptochrome-2 [Rhizoctonia solani AG-1 IA]|uniref:Cryptochrome-2 n=1 Tax=Thanatephorus cucumeris (strain AG1-IA) TaxID=983506 RepID=L8XAW9_THACA|nr:cryptochrome-2 [Rhizoctonia solani AG-1 IA]
MLATMTPKPRVLHWFRTDLRTHDAPALRAGLALKPEYSHRVGVNRFNFLIESMNDLSQSLTRLNNKSKLLVIRERDKRVREIAIKSKVEVIDVLGHSLYHPAEVLEKNGGKATTTITQWQKVNDMPISKQSTLTRTEKAASKLGSVPRPVAAPRELISPGDLHLNSLSREDHPVDREHDLNEKTRIGPVTCFGVFNYLLAIFTPIDFPQIQLGYPKPTTTIRGGEKEGRTRLFAFNKEDNGNRAALFEKPKTSPGIPGPFGTSELNNEHKEHFGTDSQEDEGEFDHVSEDTQIDVTRPSTTLMSPYLKFGCVGVRECYWSWHDILVYVELHCPYDCSHIVPRNAPKSAKKPENLLGQLEFSYIPWRCQTVYSDDGDQVIPRPKDDQHPQAEEWLAAWAEGRTGFPWIDALMRQLREEGWMHHLGRHSVACFLTRGQCYISWERGAEVFDGGYSSFSYYIYEPWLAPKSVQREAGCIIGIDYPAPMLDEKEEKNRNIERMRAAYQAGLYGDSPKVLSGNAVIELPNKPEEGEESKAGTKRKADKSAAGKARATRTRKDSNHGQKNLDAYIKKK